MPAVCMAMQDRLHRAIAVPGGLAIVLGVGVPLVEVQAGGRTTHRVPASFVQGPWECMCQFGVQRVLAKPLCSGCQQGKQPNSPGYDSDAISADHGAHLAGSHLGQISRKKGDRSRLQLLAQIHFQS